jgi:hypothetical protein
MRRAAKIDANQQAVVDALRQVGATVHSLATVGGGCPDLLVGFRGRTCLMEVKDGNKPPSERRLTPFQVLWHEQWTGGSLTVVNSPEDALKVIGVL